MLYLFICLFCFVSFGTDSSLTRNQKQTGNPTSLPSLCVCLSFYFYFYIGFTVFYYVYDVQNIYVCGKRKLHRPEKEIRIRFPATGVIGSNDLGWDKTLGM